MNQRMLTCCIRLAWVPGTRADHGRLVAYRDVMVRRSGRNEPDGRVREVWVSEPTTKMTFFEAGTIPPTKHWENLVLGRLSPVLPTAIPLHRATPDEVRQLRLYLDDRGRLQALLGLDAVLHRPVGTLTMRSAHLHAVDDDLLTQSLRPAFEAVLSTLQPAASAPRAAWPSVDSKTLSDDVAAGVVKLDDVRGVMIGDDNRQIDQYVIRTRPGEVSFEEVLGRSEVIDALQRLRSDPGNADYRKVLVHSLMKDYKFWEPEPATLRVDDGLRRQTGFLDGFFAVGVQVGDGNTQHNRFTYLLSTNPRTDTLLRENGALAAALADCLCPAPGDPPNLAELDARYHAVMRELPVKYADGVQRGVSIGAPAPGEVLRLGRMDGVTVGERTTLEVSHEVRVDRMGFDDLRQRCETLEREREMAAQREREMAAQRERDLVAQRKPAIRHNEVATEPPHRSGPSHSPW